jgi:hypothetical protein
VLNLSTVLKGLALESFVLFVSVPPGAKVKNAPLGAFSFMGTWAALSGTVAVKMILTNPLLHRSPKSIL